jgi:DNA-directed RNA polymerase subunit RPC12/RpoP
MPIRFRCAYCNQLMGIARRKAGSVVRCPTCAGQVIVPVPANSAGGAAAEANKPKAGLFEVADIDKELFNAGSSGPPAGASAPMGGTAAPPGPKAPAPGTQRHDVVPYHAPAGEVAFGEALDSDLGIFLTRGKALLLGVLMIVLLLLTFWLGFLMGSSG